MASDKAIANYRAARAVEMRMAGAAYAEIAEELEYADKSGAWRAIDRALRCRTDRAHATYTLRRLSVIDDLLEQFERPAFAGNLTAIDRVLAARNERCRLIGLV